MVGIRSFPFGSRPIFRGELLDSRQLQSTSAFGFWHYLMNTQPTSTYVSCAFSPFQLIHHFSPVAKIQKQQHIHCSGNHLQSKHPKQIPSNSTAKNMVKPWLCLTNRGPVTFFPRPPKVVYHRSPESEVKGPFASSKQRRWLSQQPRNLHNMRNDDVRWCLCWSDTSEYTRHDSADWCKGRVTLRV